MVGGKRGGKRGGAGRRRGLGGAGAYGAPSASSSAASLASFGRAGGKDVPSRLFAFDPSSPQVPPPAAQGAPRRRRTLSGGSSASGGDAAAEAAARKRARGDEVERKVRSALAQSQSVLDRLRTQRQKAQRVGREQRRARAVRSEDGEGEEEEEEEEEEGGKGDDAAAPPGRGKEQDDKGDDNDDDGGGHTASSAAAPASNTVNGVTVEPNPNNPREMVAYRSSAARATSSERMGLDRRGLSSCPVVRGEEQLRMLNLESNSISRVTRMGNLPALIFLDLYNNRLTDVSGLEALPRLRVLMLGKNQIRRVEGLAGLAHLDVCDLHGNQVAELEGLPPSLRVLNVSGNRLRTVRNLEHLQSLAELNLRRNSISSVHGLDRIRSLQRLYLSQNRLATFGAVRCVVDSRSIVDLSLDGNPLARAPYYRAGLVSSLFTLRELDGAPVSTAERRAAARDRVDPLAAERAAAEAEASAADAPDKTAAPVTRPPAAAAAAAVAAATGVPPRPSAADIADGASAPLFVRRVRGAPRVPSARSRRGGGGLGSAGSATNETGAAAEAGQKQEQPEQPDKARAKGETNKGGGGGGDDDDDEDEELRRVRADFAKDLKTAQPAGTQLASTWELDRERETLTLRGPAFGALLMESQRDRACVRHVRFLHVTFRRVRAHLGRLRAFPRLARLTLRHNGVRDFCELDPLALLDLEELSVDENPVRLVPLLREYLVVRLPSLARLDGRDVDEEEAEAASAVFGRLPRHWANRALVPNMVARERLSAGARSRVRRGARAYAASLVADACEGDRKSRLVWRLWHGAVEDVLREGFDER